MFSHRDIEKGLDPEAKTLEGVTSACCLNRGWAGAIREGIMIS